MYVFHEYWMTVQISWNDASGFMYSRNILHSCKYTIIKISYSPNWPFKWFSLKIKNPSSWSKSFLQHLLFSLGLELCSQMYGKICISPILFLLWSWHFRFSVGARGFRAASVVFMFMKPTTDVKCVGFLFFIYPIGIFCLLAQVGCLQGFFSYKTIILLLT